LIAMARGIQRPVQIHNCRVGTEPV
jgi:hypothetical protein